MKKLIGLLFIFSSLTYAWDKVPFEWSGYAALDSFYDTRDVVAFQDDIFIFYPKRNLPDKSSRSDINSSPKFNMTAIRSRLTGSLIGPKINGFDSKAVIEGDFFGAEVGIDTAFRLRLAYGALKNDHHEILFGQYWHPIRPEDCAPMVVAFNYGAPISIWARDPQFRYTYTKNKFQFIAAIVEQAQWFESNGPDGFTSLYLRRAVLPNVHAQMRYVTEERIFGVGADYKQLVPRVVNDACNSVSERVHNAAATAYFVQHFRKCDLLMQAIYAQNAVDLSSFGGYVVVNQNPLSGARSYEPIQVFSFWLDVNGKNKLYSPGLFVGFGKNLGINKTINFFDCHGKPIAYGQNPHIDFVVRIAPRFVWNLQQFQVNLELEYTGASYGKLTRHATITDGTYVDNLRVLLMLAYYF